MKQGFQGFFVALLVGMITIQYLQYRQVERFQRENVTELVALRDQVNSLQTENAALREELEQLKRNDIGSVVESAGDALVKGWNQMLDALEEELQKAEKTLQERKSGSAGGQ